MMFESFGSGDPIVAFVGAGASALPPSNLPTWTQFNTLLLEALCERLATYSGSRQPTDAMLSLFQERRDTTSFFAPDFQAQLMEEEIGADYFRVWQSLETDKYGPAHADLAVLSARGRLGAIVTTNFDRLIEAALRDQNVPFDVFHTDERFAELATRGTADGVLPVIKIHGSVEDTTSLVDTLRQRLVGRPEALMTVLRAMLVKYRWLFLGFSGADFSYDPHYLGILDAAPDAKGFVFVARVGTEVQAGVTALADAFGPQRAQIVAGDLSRIAQERTRAVRHTTATTTTMVWR